ncbi:MAG TPA: hypothetical protein PLP29_11365 [Candidatus Ozemobacteraceae bacterium]|nr:hypothetical protein [Candidatus Ozemobacteraceae bacterium]
MADEHLPSQQLIAGFQRSVYLIGIGLCILLLTIGILGWKKLWWGILIGMALGLGSFHILVVTMGNLSPGSNKVLMAKGLLLSMFKIVGLFLIIWALYGLGLDLLQVLGGLLSSQLAVVGAAAFAMAAKSSRLQGDPHA